MRSTRRLLIGALGGALLGLTPLALATAPAANAAPSHASVVQIDATKAKYLYKQVITIKGRVLVEGLGECIDTSATYCRPPDTAGQVELWRQLGGTTAWAKVDTRTNESVDFSFSTTAWQNAKYLVRYTGGTVGEHAFQPQDGIRSVKVGRHPHGSVVKSGGRLYFRGNVDPGYAGRWVTVQKKACSSCGWRNYTSVKTTSTGAYSARVYAPSSGRWYWRAYVPATEPTFASGYSAVWYTYKSFGRLAS